MEATGRNVKSYHYLDDLFSEEEEEEIHDDSHLSSMELPLPLLRSDSMLHLPAGSYLHEQSTTGSSSYTSISSSRSGTIVSTAYTSSGSRLSSISMSMEAAMHFDFDLDGENKEQIKQIMSLVQEFSIPTAGAGSMSVLERWFAELGVTWVLHLGDDGASASASAAAVLAHAFGNASSWIRALAKITETISLMVNPKTISLMGSLYCSDSDSDRGSVALPSIFEEEEEEEEESETANGKGEATAVLDRFHLGQFIQNTMMKMVDLVLVGKEQVTDKKASVQFQYQFAQFIRETMLKMLSFVEVIFAPGETTRQDIVGDGYAWVPYYKCRLNALLGVRDALSSALTKIKLSFLSQTSADAQVKMIQGEIVGLLSAADSKVDEVIWTRMQQARARFLELLTDDKDDDNSNSSGTPTWQGSSDIHETSRHVMGYVTFIQHHNNALRQIVSKLAYLGIGKYIPRFRDVEPLNSLQMELVSCLQENLASKSELFLDQGLKFLFLINNLYFILVNYTSDSYFIRYPFWVATSSKPASIEVATIRLLSGYLKSYIQVSWAPLLACLSNATPLCFGRDYSQLSKFESEFQRVYLTQKQWKVPDPMMRGMLRDQITRRLIPEYTKYIKDNKATTPKFSPRDLEHKLQQLFEG